MPFAKIISLLCITLFLTSQPTLAETVTPSDRVTTSLKVRAEPSTSSQEVGRLRLGESADLIESVPHWYHVKLSDDTEGYVYKSWSKLLTSSSQQLEVHFIDVGQGDSTLVICPNGKNILVDAGSSADGDVDKVKDYIVNELDKHERRINSLIITHPDTDHYNLIPDITANIHVDHIFSVGQVEDYRTSFQEWLNGKPDNIKTVLDSNYFDPAITPNPDIDCGAAEVYFLASAINSNFSRKNTMSIVTMIRYGSFEVLLTGDATKKTEEAIIGRYDNNWLDVDVLKIGHHGSLSTSTTQQWADIVKPELAVVSAGNKSSHGHPRKEVLERLDDHTVDNAAPHLMSSATGTRGNYTWHNDSSYSESIYSTDTNGNVVVTSDGGGYSAKTSFHEE
ncbi:SH3 domain-containing protein [Pseudomonadota bacterium]